MSETPSQNHESSSSSWDVLRENVTRTMLHETGFGKPLHERYDEEYGPQGEGWKWESYPLTDEENVAKEARGAEFGLAHEALMNYLATGNYETRDGIDGSKLEGRASRTDIDPFGRVFVRHDDTLPADEEMSE